MLGRRLNRYMYYFLAATWDKNHQNFESSVEHIFVLLRGENFPIEAGTERRPTAAQMRPWKNVAFLEEAKEPPSPHTRCLAIR